MMLMSSAEKKLEKLLCTQGRKKRRFIQRKSFGLYLDITVEIIALGKRGYLGDL